MINQTNTQRSDAGSLCQIENSNAVFSLLIAWNDPSVGGGGFGHRGKLLRLMRFIITPISNYFVYLMQLVTENLKGEHVMTMGLSGKLVWSGGWWTTTRVKYWQILL